MIPVNQLFLKKLSVLQLVKKKIRKRKKMKKQIHLNYLQFNQEIRIFMKKNKNLKYQI